MGEQDDNHGELIKTARANLYESLELIASKEEQLEYQKNVPIAYLPEELFWGWVSDFQDIKDRDWFVEAFSGSERDIIEEFDAIFEQVSARVLDNLPSLNEFIDTPEWNTLSSAAQKALTKLKAQLSD